MMKFISALLLAGTVALVGASTAQATHEPGHTYPAVATATVSDPVVVAGQAFVFRGTGMLPGETVNIVASNGTAAVLTMSTTADANGSFAVTMTLTEPGTFTLTATGAQSGVQVSAVVTVAAAAIVAAGAETALPETGADSRLLIWGAAGAGALALGAATVVIARRRNS